jgi:hypothetical protein
MVGSASSTAGFALARERVGLVVPVFVGFAVGLVAVLVLFAAVVLVAVFVVLVPVAFSLTSDFVPLAAWAWVRFLVDLVSFSTVAVAVFLARLRVLFGACSELEPEVTAFSPRIWAQDTPLRSRGVEIHLSTSTPNTQARSPPGISRPRSSRPPRNVIPRSDTPLR